MVELKTGSKGQYYGSLIYTSDSLSMEEMEVNATYIYKYLTDQGWSKNAIAGILGNLQAESTINPGRWQNDTIEESNGYGLVQWTPSTKYSDWAISEGIIDMTTMDSNLQRIIYEVDNNIQWIATDEYNLSFKEFTKSDRSVSELAKAFLLCYERPKDQSESVQNYRSLLAEDWYSYLGGVPTDPSDPESETKKKRNYNFTIFNANKRRKSWIKQR